MNIIYNKSSQNQPPKQKKYFKQSKIKKFNTFAGVHYGHEQNNLADRTPDDVKSIYSKLSPLAQKFLYELIKFRTYYFGSATIISQAVLAKRLGVRRATANEKLAEIHSHEIITSYDRYRGNKRLANGYIVNIDLSRSKLLKELSDIFPILNFLQVKLLKSVYLNTVQRIYKYNDAWFHDVEGRTVEECKQLERITLNGSVHVMKANLRHDKDGKIWIFGHEPKYMALEIPEGLYDE